MRKENSIYEDWQEEKSVSLGIYPSDEINLYFFDIAIRTEERLKKDKIIYYEVFAPEGELEKYILEVEEMVRCSKEDIKQQKLIVKNFKTLIIKSGERKDILEDEVCVGNFLDATMAREVFNLDSLRCGGATDMILMPVCNRQGEDVAEKLESLYEFFVDKQELKGYIQALENRILKNCMDTKFMQFFLEAMKDIQRRVGG